MAVRAAQALFAVASGASSTCSWTSTVRGTDVANAVEKLFCTSPQSNVSASAERLMASSPSTSSGDAIPLPATIVYDVTFNTSPGSDRWSVDSVDPSMSDKLTRYNNDSPMAASVVPAANMSKSAWVGSQPLAANVRFIVVR